MLRFFDIYASLFKSWSVTTYEQEQEAYALKVSAVLLDDSRLEIRDYLFATGERRYAYHWMDADGALRRRWDNAPHYRTMATFPHHCHTPESDDPQGSTVTNLEDLFDVLKRWFEDKS